ncbi:MAG: adventurous gliding motility lipoprotein CglC [Deltaproteobacteria bacterium]
MRHVGPLALALFAACSPPSDIGSPCLLRQADGGVWLSAQSPTDDYLYQGSPQCQNLVCLRPAGSPLDAGYGICSNICTPTSPSNPNSPSEDCGGSSSGYVCRTIALDPAFIQAVEQADGGQALLDAYLGGPNADFCTTPK